MVFARRRLARNLLSDENGVPRPRRRSRSPSHFLGPNTIETPKTADDDESSSSSSDDSSILSRLEDRSYYDDSEKEEEDEYELLRTLEEKWEDLARKFAVREGLLERISRGKSRDFVRQLRQREQAVRHQTFSRLIQTEARNEDQKKHFQQRLDDEIFQSFSKGHAGDRDPKSFSRRCYDWCVFELNSSVPAMFSLFVHNVVHITFLDAITSVSDLVRRGLSDCSFFQGPKLDVAFFCFGILLMRTTGDLFWWLSDQDYDCVKFDMHNRLLLRCWDASVLSAVRARDVLRVALFMTGFYVVYTSTLVLLTYMQRPFDQTSEILENMPSANLEAPKQALLVSFCSNTCQDEIERQGALTRWCLSGRIC